MKQIGVQLDVTGAARKHQAVDHGARLLSSGASVSSVALKAGINANQLRKWIGQNRQAMQSDEGALSALVPVVAAAQSIPASLARRRCPAEARTRHHRRRPLKQERRAST
ncbi:transposase [Cupriavidus sp. CP313]